MPNQRQQNKYGKAVCPFCQKEFSKNRKWQRYCCPEHRSDHYWSTHEVVKRDTTETEMVLGIVQENEQNEKGGEA